MFLKLFIISVVFIGILFLGLGVKLLFTKKQEVKIGCGSVKDADCACEDKGCENH